MAEADTKLDSVAGQTDSLFEFGSQWLRADFHLHTKGDKEFIYDGEKNSFVNDYVQRLAETSVRLGVITNHNKFDADEYKALRKRARKQCIGLLPGVELSVNDGANGIHTLVIFSDEWLEGGQDYINQFLNVAFAGKPPAQYGQENGRSNDDLLTTLKKLEGYDRDFFILFAHVEASSGLWKEIDGGRMQELAKNPLIQKYCLGFQKVRTHNKPDAKCRVKVQQWWGDRYPAEVEGSDPKKMDQIGRSPASYLKLGEFSFDAVKYALTDFNFRIAKKIPGTKHSRIDAIRFEGGLLDGKRVTFSPHLNCLIGIQGSGKSSVLESVRYALEIPFGEKAQDKDYKQELLPYVLKSGGKVVVEATDRLGTSYEIRRIWGHEPDVYIDGELRPGVSIRETIIAKPLYFGQKDLTAAGKGFGHDLVEKLMGNSLKSVRQNISECRRKLEVAVEVLLSVRNDAEEMLFSEEELKDVVFRLEQFDKYGVKEKLDKQVAFANDLLYCETIDELTAKWHIAVEESTAQASEAFREIETHESKYNAPLFVKYEKKLTEIRKTITAALKLGESVGKVNAKLLQLHEALEVTKDGLKEEFSEIERDLVKALEEEGVTSIQPDAYIKLMERKTELETLIAELEKRTSKEKRKHDDVLKAVAKLNDAWHGEYMLIAKALNRINTAQSSLQVESTFKGDKGVFRDYMENKFRGNNIRKETYESLATGYMDFAEIYKDLDKAAGHAKSKAETLKEIFLRSLFTFLSYQVPNGYDVTYHGKLLKSHSLGQRASAMMLFLLSQDENDLLLIDQPEDDLDSQTVYEEVVKLLRIIKLDRQFIFATHNANFPVLGDAEMVASCSMQDEAISVASGSIDSKDCQTRIISIMEGGPEAFERRKSIYQIWNTGAS